MIAVIHGRDLGELLEKIKSYGIDPEEKQIPVVNLDGRVVASSYYHFRFLLADIYFGLPEDSCLIVGSKSDISGVLSILNIPSHNFEKIVCH